MRMIRSAVPDGPSRATAMATPRARRRWSAVLATVVAAAVTLTGTAGPALADRDHDRHKDNAFRQINLVSDIPELGAPVTDPLLKNPWGIAFGPTSPLWTANQFSNSSTLYRGTGAANALKAPLEVSAASPTGIVFNPTTEFVVTQNGITAPSRFIFTETVFSETAPPVTSITGWHNGTATVPGSMGKVGGFYAGLALVPAPEHGKGGPALLAADSAPGGNIDVYDAQFRLLDPDKRHAFIDPNIDLTKTPPYNVAYLDGRVYVAYAPPFGAEGDSAVSVFTADGKFRKRLDHRCPVERPVGYDHRPEGLG